MTGGAVRVRLLAVRQALDEQTLEELVTDEARALGVGVATTWVDDLSALTAAVRDATAAGEPLVVLAAPSTPDLAELGDVGDGQVLRLDVAVRAPDRTPGLVAHQQGRGTWGVVWALRAVHHRWLRPPHVVPYAEGPEQLGELRLPADGGGHAPLAVLLHGGFWRSCWQLDLMDAVSIDLAERGVATWNVEYRRPDRHGWTATVDDVRRALAHVEQLAHEWPLDVERVGVIGHSAGGSLAVQAAADAVGQRPPVRLVVQLAGLVDLVGTHLRDIGNGAVSLALGGAPVEVPEVYASVSPLERLPTGVPQLVVVGLAESPDLREMSRRYVRAAQVAGDDVTLVEDTGDHFSVIDPASKIWRRAADVLADRLH